MEKNHSDQLFGIWKTKQPINKPLPHDFVSFFRQVLFQDLDRQIYLIYQVPANCPAQD